MKKETFVKQVEAIRAFTFSDMDLPEEAFKHIDQIVESYEVEAGTPLGDTFWNGIFHIESGMEGIEDAWEEFLYRKGEAAVKEESKRTLEDEIALADMEARLEEFDERLTALEQYDRG